MIDRRTGEIWLGDVSDSIVGNGLTVYPGTNKEVYTNTATLTFYRKELLYDIRNVAYVEGDVMLTDDSHDRHQVQDIGEDGNVDRVTRVIDLVVAQARELLYPYTKSDVDDSEERDDELEEPEKYVIEMLLPDDFSKSTLTYLEKLIHEFIVYRVLADWMSIANVKNPSSAQNWDAKAGAVSDEIDSTLHARMRRVRRTMSPFDNGVWKGKRLKR